jgi:WW domain-containing oxidoreductase
LTALLLPLLKNGRVVNVSSLGHHIAGPKHLDYSFSKLKNHYDSMEAYGFSKLAQIYHASELTRRYGIKAYSLHPGFINKTSIQSRNKLSHRLIIERMNILSKTLEQGAMTSLFCALSDDAKPGHFHSNCQVAKPSALALDTRRAEECWNESEKLINAKTK